MDKPKKLSLNDFISKKKIPQKKSEPLTPVKPSRHLKLRNTIHKQKVEREKKSPSKSSYTKRYSNMRWVIKDQLARANRPGYPAKNPTKEDLIEWVKEAKKMGIKSIIVILYHELGGYKPLHKRGLLSFYRKHGFKPYLIPQPDFKKPVIHSKNLDKLKEAFLNAEKPVLVHCSAGIDRTGRAIDYLFSSGLIKGEREDQWTSSGSSTFSSYSQRRGRLSSYNDRYFDYMKRRELEDDPDATSSTYPNIEWRIDKDGRPYYVDLDKEQEEKQKKKEQEELDKLPQVDDEEIDDLIQTLRRNKRKKEKSKFKDIKRYWY